MDHKITLEAIKQAESYLVIGPAYDPHLANYVLRNLPIVKANPLINDLAWAMHRDGSLSINDVRGLIDDIHKAIFKEDEK